MPLPFFALALISITLGSHPAPGPALEQPAFSTPATDAAASPTLSIVNTTVEPERLNRLSEIAGLLQDRSQNTAALLTEASRLCGFVIWNEGREKLAEPLGAPRLQLAITDVEIKEYAQMFRAGHSVVLSDLIGMLDVVYKGVGSEPSCEPMVMDWLTQGVRSRNPSIQALCSFLQDLSSYRGNGASSMFMRGDEVLDPVQTLLILRVLTQEIGGALRNVIAKEKPTTLLASLAPEQEKEVNGTAEDAWVGGYTGLWGSITEATGKAETYGKKVGKANAILSIVKFITTYLYLSGDILVEAPGQPLIRTLGSRPSDAGQYRKVVAKFWLDGTKVTDWLKDNRSIVALAGLDLDMPKTGALKGLPTEWIVKQGTLRGNQLITVEQGGPQLDKVVTDKNGEATVGFEGLPQPVALDPKKVMPLDRIVPITVTPQVKEVTAQQDLVDAVLGAIGLKDGPTGLLTPVMEMLYRMKWKGAVNLLLHVQDWRQGDTVGQLEITIKAAGHDFTSEKADRMSINRNLVFQDIGMIVAGGEVPGLTIDPRILEKLGPVERKQMEDGMKQMADLAKKRDFIGDKPGTVDVSINDSAFSRSADGCDLVEVTQNRTWTGAFHGEFADQTEKTHQSMFRVSVDTEQKVARVTGSSMLNVIVTGATRGGPKLATQKSATASPNAEVEPMSIFARLDIKPPFKGGEVEIPLKETPVIGTNATNYYGSISIPFTFGPDNRYSGNIIFAYSVTRLAAKPK